MVNSVRKILADFVGLNSVCGPRVALKWLSLVALNLRECLARGDLQPADRAMGEGPFTARLGSARAKLVGPQTIGGIRELWVRDSYLGGGFLAIPDGARVVDLGANMGAFTLLALGHGPNVRVTSVEANRVGIGMIRRALAMNGWTDRVALVNRFIGLETQWQSEAKESGTYDESAYMSEAELVDRAGLERIDFLKCDIEGSEFGLLTRESKLLAMSDQLAIELHDFAGDRRAFKAMLTDLGYEHVERQSDSNGCILLARREGNR